MAKPILVIEDNPFEREAVASLLAELDTSIHFSDSALDAHTVIRKREDSFSLAIIDLDLGSRCAEGIEVLRRYKQKFPKAPAIVRTCHGNIEHIAAIRSAGVDGVCIKGEDDEHLKNLCHSLLNREAELTRDIQWPKEIFPTAELENWNDRLPKILDSAICHIHLFGESGSGKEVFADLLQSASETSVPFIRVNCAAISSGVFASEFYGHKRGSFTGAIKDRPGYLTRANGGWLFLDEVQCLSPEAQASLLRAMESGEFLPVGSDHPVRMDVKVLSASNLNIGDLVKEGKFRLDLEQRLCEVKIRLQGINSCRTKLEKAALIEHMAKNMKGGPYKLTPSCLAFLSNLKWERGHFRELRNTLRAMTEFQCNSILTSASIPSEYLTRPSDSKERIEENDFEYSVNHLMVQKLKNLTEKNPGISLRRMAIELEISRSTLVRRIRSADEKGLISVELASRIPTILEGNAK